MHVKTMPIMVVTVALSGLVLPGYSVAQAIDSEEPLMFPAEIMNAKPIGRRILADPELSQIELYPMADGEAWGVRHHQDSSYSIFHCTLKPKRCQIIPWSTDAGGDTP